MSITIKNGQFIDESGKVVKPEFGNREQINALKTTLGDAYYDKNAKMPSEKVLEGELSVRIDERTTYSMEHTWDCPSCGHRNGDEDFTDYEDEPDEDDMETFIGDVVECYKCRKEFRVTHDYGKQFIITSIEEEDE